MCAQVLPSLNLIWRMLAAALLNQSVSRQQAGLDALGTAPSSPAPLSSTNWTQYEAALSRRLCAGGGDSRYRQAAHQSSEVGCLCLLSPLNSNSPGAAVLPRLQAQPTATSYGGPSQFMELMTRSPCISPLHTHHFPRESARMRKGDVFMHRNENDCRMQALWTQAMPWLAWGSPAQLGGDQAALHQATG